MHVHNHVEAVSALGTDNLGASPISYAIVIILKKKETFTFIILMFLSLTNQEKKPHICCNIHIFFFSPKY